MTVQNDVEEVVLGVLETAMARLVTATSALPDTVDTAYDCDPISFTVMVVEIHDAASAFLETVRKLNNLKWKEQ